jgi:hypothetical protein
MKNQNQPSNLHPQNNLLSNIIKEDYESYYVNSGVDLLLLERSFIDSAIDALSGKAKSIAGGLANKGATKIRDTLSFGEKRKRVKITNRVKSNLNQIHRLSMELIELEDRAGGKADEDEIQAINDKIIQLEKENSRYKNFVLPDVKFFNSSDSPKEVISYTNKNKLGDVEKYMVLNHQYTEYLKKLGENNPNTREVKAQLDALGTKLYDKGGFKSRLQDDVNDFSDEENIILEDLASLIKDKLNNFKKTLKDKQSRHKLDRAKDEGVYKFINFLINDVSKLKKTTEQDFSDIGKLILNDKDNFKKFNDVKLHYTLLEKLFENLLDKNNKVSLYNKNLHPSALYFLHYNLTVFCKFIILLHDAIKNNKLNENKLLATLPKLKVLNRVSDNILNSKNILEIEDLLMQVVKSLFQNLETFKFPENIKKREQILKEFFEYMNPTEDSAETKEVAVSNKKNETQNTNTTKAISIPKKTIADMSKFSEKKRAKIVELLNNFVNSVGEKDPNIQNKVDKFVNSNMELFKNNITEGFAHVRWRRNPRTGLDKIVMTCKSDEYKKPLNREISVAGKKVKEVMCLPKTAKPAKQKEKDRKASLKRWRKIKANPGKMKKMFIKRKQTKARSKTLR